MKKIWISFVFVFMLVFGFTKFDVQAAEQRDVEEAQRVANVRYANMIELIKLHNADFGIPIGKLQDTYIGAPFIIVEEGSQSQDEIYYFPLINRKDEVVLVLSVMGTNKGWRVAMDTEYVELLKP